MNISSALTLMITLFGFLFFLSKASANSMLVITDETRDLSYFVEGQKREFESDLASLKAEFQSKQLVLVRIKSKTEDGKFNGVLELVGGKNQVEAFEKTSNLFEVYKNYVTRQTHVLIWGHTVDNKDLKNIFPSETYQFASISSSACEMATTDNLEVFKRHSEYFLGSPINVHLAHFEYEGIEELLREKDPLVFLERFSNRSFERLEGISVSNLSLGIYSLNKLQGDGCEQANEVLYDHFYKPAIYETRAGSDKEFFLKGCL